MRGICLLFAALMLSLLSSAQTLVPINVSPGESHPEPPNPAWPIKPSTSPTLSTNEIAISSILSTSETPNSTPDNAEVTSTAATNPLSSASPAATSTGSDANHKNLIIILGCVLGTIAVLLVSAALYLLLRYRRDQSFTGRGVTPIDDNEIESWRRSGNERKAFAGDNLVFDKETGGRDDIRSQTIQMVHSPGWTWTASPTSSRSRSTFYPSGFSGHIPDSPTFLAQAPNARVGLTDEIMPGAEPFIKPAERHRSRLSKPGCHARTKSRRSSLSDRSMWSIRSGNGGELKELKANDRMTTWYDPEDDFRVHEEYNDSSAMSFRGMAPSPETPNRVTALSPRPPPRAACPPSWNNGAEIGLAIS
ncbi:hypothetical protein DSL72_004940 [Monilinia vaccinii-corymbosi]|uniref:Mid2 domain-containing protein n=1 Tax=Monilinia vaccinii-corymbosi TaxID=61207 RepID=A0A8A3PA38_9HELO|nr:hypothetical protein DSL72_004940 [Monilinia vaccinii-corymbosi]